MNIKRGIFMRFFYTLWLKFLVKIAKKRCHDYSPYYLSEFRGNILHLLARFWPATINSKPEWPEKSLIFHSSGYLTFGEIMRLVGILIQETKNQKIIFPIDRAYCVDWLVEVAEDLGIYLVPIPNEEDDETVVRNCLDSVIDTLGKNGVLISLDQFDYDVDFSESAIRTIKQSKIIHVSMEKRALKKHYMVLFSD